MTQVLKVETVKTKDWPYAVFGITCAAMSMACVLIPLYIIRPFHHQGSTALGIALWIHEKGPNLAGLGAILVLLSAISSWMGKVRAIWLRIGMISLFAVASTAAYLTHINVFEKMFHPYDEPSFESAADAGVDRDDMVLAVVLGGHARAYPILVMGYHHIVNDTVENLPIAVTYCTLCHTGLVWDPVINGKRLHFRLAGINNGNALMRDEETRTVWQQSTGEAIFGALRGEHLKLIHSSEMTYALWRKEQPHGDVLKPSATYSSNYEKRGWESHIEKTPSMIDTKKSGIQPHQLMLGVQVAGTNKAYAINSILAVKLIQDKVADSAVLVVVGPDGASMRVFEAAELEFVIGEGEGMMQDTETGSRWNFQGCAVSGQLAGRCLKEIDGIKTYWFDWVNHHPDTAVFFG